MVRVRVICYVCLAMSDLPVPIWSCDKHSQTGEDSIGCMRSDVECRIESATISSSNDGLEAESMMRGSMQQSTDNQVLILADGWYVVTSVYLLTVEYGSHVS